MAKIMLCDDSRTIVMILERKLNELGHQVIAKAKDGEEGVTAFESARPEILILDVTMPNKDGRECLKEILQKHPSAKIIMLSALNEKNVMDECISAGAKAFLSKSNIQNETFAQDLNELITKVMKAA